MKVRPQSGVVINNSGKTASYKGNSIVHTHDDADWDEVKTWFYAALSGTAQRPDDVNARNFEKFLDSPHRVIIETEANLVVSFDVAKFNEFTAGNRGRPRRRVTPHESSDERADRGPVASLIARVVRGVGHRPATEVTAGA